ncbi:amino acid ABC transporter permease [Clostridium cylindrosporum]|uniref:Glutamine transport system permease protein GlnP n=1 Tax=Clostridium cylindrosporum DSM 605 TaxID=1121307 RepID=A0A0J8D7F1_CLOCY|nr:amino acid ABC transporter permease [Clostridium cylindrosporum]KMT21985.1 glutamine transport system permease protein GlnP [Clostridium cylindrosporum DSM 605]
MDNTGLNLVIKSLPLLWDGLQQTLYVAVVSIIIGILGGILFGIIRSSKNILFGIITRIFIEFFRAVPLLVWLFIFFFGLPLAFNMDISAKSTSIIVFSLWAITEIGEIVRGSIESIPKGQVEAGKSLGLNRLELYRYVLLPQAIKRTIPSSINVCTRVIKTTSLTVLIGVVELIKVGQQIIERTSQSAVIYTSLFVIYFLLCYPLSLYSKKLEGKFSL